MPSDDKTSGKGVNIDIGLSAKASVEVKTEIPAQSSGRLIDALTDAIRPFTEARGLKADLIRLQREDVAFQITQKARARLEIEGHVPQPVPNKFLVPLLEKGSLEADNDLIDRWADLLASASIEPNAAHPRFVQILSEMTGGDAKLLRAIAFKHLNESDYPDAAFSDCVYDFEPDVLRTKVRNWLAKETREINALYGFLEDLFASPGVELVDLIVSGRSADQMWSLPSNPATDIYTLDKSVNFQVLYSLNVLKEHVVHISPGYFDIDVIYVSFTSLGISFLKQCDRDLVEALRRKAD